MLVRAFRACWVAFVIAVPACGGGSAANSVDSGGDTSQQDAGSLTSSGSIGPAGGSVTLGLASITIPPGALTKLTRISLTQRSDSPPAAYASYSALYEFDPSGQTFLLPATVVLPRYSGPSSAAVYWSKPQGGAYDRLPSTLGKHVVSAQVVHFSTGFVGGPATAGDASADGPGPGNDGGALDANGRDGSSDASRDDAQGDSASDSAPGCQIAGVSYSSGATNPANSCQTCQPATSAAAWTNAADGTGCASGEICYGGACTAGCEVGGVFYSANAVSATNACQVCEPATTTSSLSSAADGTSCGNGQVCGGGLCGTQCDIGSALYASGTGNPTNACQTCQPGTSTSAWTVLADGTSCGTDQICSGGSCTPACEIGGVAFLYGAANPGNACQSCQPATSAATWSDVPDGSSCGSAQICVAGTCGTECDIGGVVFAPGAVDPGNACASCQPGTSTSAWSALPNGTSCGPGESCASAACASCAPTCSDGNACGADTDCGSGVCTNNQCAVPACSPTCATGDACGANADCSDGICSSSGQCGGSATFEWTGPANQQFTVPAGVTQITVTATGGQGGGPCYTGAAVGGMGGSTTATFAVPPGEGLEILVARWALCGPQMDWSTLGGEGGWANSSDAYAGNGGGASTVAVGVIGYLVAGGGGGSSGASPGGAGGGLVGQAAPGNAGGGGGTQSAGGAEGTGSSPGSPGERAMGGAGAIWVTTDYGLTGGGGGGGGYYGGGGGALGGGGGGGSSYVSGGTSVTMQQGVSFAGTVTVAW